MGTSKQDTISQGQGAVTPEKMDKVEWNDQSLTTAAVNPQNATRLFHVKVMLVMTDCQGC